MRIGLDIHGVIDNDPVFFSDFSKLCKNTNNDIVIITGSYLSPQLISYLKDLSMYWNELYSITNYNLDKKIPVSFDEKGNPWIEEFIWNQTKAVICNEYNVDIHIDDSSIYQCHFDKKYIYYQSELKLFWFNDTSYHISDPKELLKLMYSLC